MCSVWFVCGCVMCGEMCGVVGWLLLVCDV